MTEYGFNMYRMFVGFKAAYDSIERARPFKVMEEFHVPRKLRCLVEVTLETIRCGVKTFNEITESFETKKGFTDKEMPCRAFCLI
jgi:sorting nexin-29